MTAADFIPLDQAERKSRTRPTVEGSKEAWLKLHGPVHAPSLAYKPVPEREWLVDGLIPAKTVTLLSGDGEMGKSTLAVQLAASVVLGKDWLGRATRQGMVAYVSCEDDIEELQRRLAAICKAEGWDIADLDGLELWDRVGRDSSLMVRGERFAEWEDSIFWMRFSEWCRDNLLALVVLDSLYDFFVGDQLSQAAARLFMGKLRELAHDVGCAIVVLWHPSKSGMDSGDGTSGVVAFRNSARSMLYLDRQSKEDRNGPRVLRQRKNNYGPTVDPITIQWENGRFALADAAPEAPKAKRLATDPQLALECLNDLLAISDKRHPGSSYIPANVAYVEVSTWRDLFFARKPADSSEEAKAKEAKRKAFKRAAETLQRNALIGLYGDAVWIAQKVDT